MGISQGEPSRREIRSKNHTRPGQNGATKRRRSPSWCTLQNSRVQSNRGKGVQTKLQPRLHYVSWKRDGQPEWTVRGLLSREQVHLSLAELPPNLFHHLRFRFRFRFFIIRHIHNHTSIISSEMQVELKKNTAFT